MAPFLGILVVGVLVTGAAVLVTGAAVLVTGAAVLVRGAAVLEPKILHSDAENPPTFFSTVLILVCLVDASSNIFYVFLR